MAKQTKQSVAPFKQVVAALLDTTRPFPATYLHRFSDIQPDDLATLQIAWPQVPVERRANLLEDLEEIKDSDTLVVFDDVARFALNDRDPRVRATAINLLWECADTKLIPIFIQMMEKDADEIVRATAASALGMFIYEGEVEEIPVEKLRIAEASLLKTVSGEDKPVVRRRALEALGFSSRDEVPEIIEKAFHSTDKDWIASALFAMGRSANEKWTQAVLSKIEDPEPDVRLEAIRASGELGIMDAREPLLQFLEEYGELDDETRPALVWALSQIGGEGVKEALEELAENLEDDDELEVIEEALENLDFTNEMQNMEMLDLDSITDQDRFRVIDLENDPQFDDDDSPNGGKPKKKQQ